MLAKTWLVRLPIGIPTPPFRGKFLGSVALDDLLAEIGYRAAWGYCAPQALSEYVMINIVKELGNVGSPNERAGVSL